jgi:hypothetical protein
MDQNRPGTIKDFLLSRDKKISRDKSRDKILSRDESRDSLSRDKSRKREFKCCF